MLLDRALPLFFFNLWKAATQLARQVQQECTKLAWSNEVTRKRLAESSGTPAVDLRHMNVGWYENICMLQVCWGHQTYKFSMPSMDWGECGLIRIYLEHTNRFVSTHILLNPLRTLRICMLDECVCMLQVYWGYGDMGLCIQVIEMYLDIECRHCSYCPIEAWGIFSITQTQFNWISFLRTLPPPGTRFLSFFLGVRRPNVITGLSGCRAPD